MKNKILTIFKNMLNKKSTDFFIKESNETELKKTLNIFDLLILGVSAVVGTGIFTIIGSAIVGSTPGTGAGTSVVISMLLAATASLFSALAYSEIAAMIPVAGSAYTFTYATMGEFMAWMVGWILMLEYAIGNITVATAWTGYLGQLLKGFKHILPDFVVNFPLWLRNDFRSIYAMCDKYNWDVHDKMPFINLPFGIEIPVAVNIPAIFIVLFLTVLLIRGVKESTRVAGIMVFVNLSIIISFVLIGSHYVMPENWTWLPLNVDGLKGILSGTFIIFFAYIGFDAISTAAEETKNPQRDLPAAILGTLLFCTILYVSVALVLTGIIPLNNIDTQAPLAHAMRMIGKNWYAGAISVGALCALTSVLLVYQLGTTRIFYAIARDNFLPRNIMKINKKYQTPHIITWISGLIVIFGSLFMDLNISAELCNYGTFASFVIICIEVLILRKTDPDRFRPFKVPFCPLFPILGIIMCSCFMLYKSFMGGDSSLYFLLWILMGLAVYVLFGYKNKRIYDEKDK